MFKILHLILILIKTFFKLYLDIKSQGTSPINKNHHLKNKRNKKALNLYKNHQNAVTKMTSKNTELETQFK